MPIYEYSCSNCSSKFELLRPGSQSNEPAPCPQCEAVAERILSGFSCRTTVASGAVASMAGTSSACGSCASSSCTSCGG
jgi:putative FmdB family regulatory protein